MRVLVSACLLGERVRYNAESVRVISAILKRWAAEGRIVSFCPEVAAGLAVPRPAAEITGGGGRDVLEGRARVLAATGTDLTAAFLAGARQALEVARAAGARIAVLKERSPSCGGSIVYDGTFRGVRRPGAGVTAALLAANGIEVFSEDQLEEANLRLEQLERELR